MRLRVADHQISINDKLFDFSNIDRLAYWSTSRRSTGVYTDTTFWLKLGQGDQTATFYSDSGSRDRRLEEGRAWWNRVSSILSADVQPRVLAEMIRTIDANGNVTFGGAGSLAADARGLRKRTLFARPIPWKDMVGTVFEQGLTQVVQRTQDGSTKNTLRFSMSQWNAVTIPALIAHYRS